VRDVKAAMKSQWGAAAPGWDRWFSWYERHFQPSMAFCCDAGQLKPGSLVLDVGCGTGQAAIAAARRVAPGGRLVATDIAPEMLDVARRRAAQAGLANIEFRAMDGEQLDFPDDTFDAVTCAYALMFCPDAVRAVAEARRVLKAGGRFAAVVWDEPSKNPFLTVAGEAIAQFFPAAPPNPNAPGAFRFARPGILEETLRAGGFTEVAIDSRAITIECASSAEYWQMFVDHAAGMSSKVAQLGESDRMKLIAAVDAGAGRYVADGCVKLLATTLCAVAVKTVSEN
jgi:SAM-dependent methyltransferase